MAYSPISGTVPQYMKDAAGTTADDYYLKFYRSGTTTAILMATDSEGETTLAKCKLNVRGEPISDDSSEESVFIPHLEEAYKIALYTNATDADNNAINSAVWVVDNIPIVTTGAGTGIGYASVVTDAVSGATALDVEKAFENTYRRVLGSSLSDVMTYTVNPNSSETWTAGATITFHLQGEGEIIIAPGSGVTINKPDFSPDDANVSIKHKGQTVILKYVSTNEWDALIFPVPFGEIVTRTSTSNSPTVAWSGRVNYMENASAQTITLENAATRDWQIGQRIDFVRQGAGTVTFAAGSGVTINSAAGNLSMKNRYSAASVIYKGSDVFTLFGDLDT